MSTTPWTRGEGIATDPSARLHDLRVAVVTGVLYLVAARYAIAVNEPVAAGAALWPAAGVTMTALLASRRAAWPWILLAVATAELVNDLLHGYPGASAVIWAGGNVVEPLLVASLVVRWRADRLRGVRDVVHLLGAVAAGVLVGGLVGVLGTRLAGSVQPYGVLALKWAAGDALGALAVLPAGLLLLQPSVRGRLRSGEAALVGLAVVATSLAVFTLDSGDLAPALPALVLLPTVWAATRLRTVGATLSVLVVAMVADPLTARGHGPFAVGGPEQDVVVLQVYLLAVAVAVLLLGARSDERDGLARLAEARHHLLSVVSHELRTPLTPILGFTESLLVRGRGLDPGTRQGLEVVDRNARHLLGLVDDLLAVSRMRRGTTEVRTVPVDAAALAREVVTDLGHDDVAVHDEDGVPPVRADARQLAREQGGRLTYRPRRGGGAAFDLALRPVTPADG